MILTSRGSVVAFLFFPCATQLTDVVIVLNTVAAVEAFTSKGQVRWWNIVTDYIGQWNHGMEWSCNVEFCIGMECRDNR